MHDIQYQFIKNIIEGAQTNPKKRGKAFASSNIALCKYWGKRDAELNLPINSSLSISLGHLGTRTELRVRDGDITSAKAEITRLEAFVEVMPSSLFRRSDALIAPYVASEKHETNYFDPREPTAHLAGNLPHWRQDGGLYFVTFRLADSLPAGKLKELQSEKDLWLQQSPKPAKDSEEYTPWQNEYKRLFQDRVDGWLDAGQGGCILEDSSVRDVVEETLFHSDGNQYRLDSFVVMPNHVHILVAPLKDCLLSDIVKAWKSVSARKIMKMAGMEAPVWQKEYFDYIVRSPEGLEKFREYICSNPQRLNHRKRDEGIASTNAEPLKSAPSTEAMLSTLSHGRADMVYLNGKLQPSDSSFAKRISAFLDLFRPMLGNAAFEVRTENNIPTAAGLASSASGFAALVMALDDWAGWGLDKKKLSILARLGSGSASRSIYNGFAQWNAGTLADGTDSFAEPLPETWPEFRIGILELSSAKKAVGSRDGMNRTVETSALYKSWPQQAAADLEIIHTAIIDHDFSTLGKTAERNALSMHATMMASWPPLIYLQPETIEQIHKVQRVRAEGLEVYLTIDAGPNIKLLFLKENEVAVAAAFPGLKTINPFN